MGHIGSPAGRRQLSRRELLRAGVGLTAVGCGVDGLLIEPGWLAVTDHEVPVPLLPAALEGFSIVQVTDLHLTSLSGLHESVIRAVAAVHPQLVAVTGDSVEDAASLRACEELIREISHASERVVAIPGNWEHWGGVPMELLKSSYARAGAELLLNQSKLAGGIALAATDDFCSGNAMPALALRAMPTAPVRLMITHAPELLDDLDPKGPKLDLMLAGHTHGGQITLGGVSLRTPPGSGRFVAGWYHTPAGRAYVSRGVGLSVIPARLMCRPEIAVFRLVRG